MRTSFHTRNHIKKPICSVMHVCNPSIGNVETDRSLEITGQPIYSISTMELQIQRETVLKSKMPIVNLWILHIHYNTQTHTTTQTHQNTHIQIHTLTHTHYNTQTHATTQAQQNTHMHTRTQREKGVCYVCFALSPSKHFSGFGFCSCSGG